MKIISCFSYKGGAGRTTLLLNVTPYLAKDLNATEEKPLVLIDMDVDSCGLTYFFDLVNNANIDRINTQSFFGNYGSIPKDDDVESALEHKLFTGLFAVGKWFGLPDRAVLCLPAMPGSALGTNNYDGNSSKVQEFLEECDGICCGVVFDSAVGNQLTAGWSLSFSSEIICCMRPTKQFRDGTIRFFRDYNERNTGKRVIVVPNVVPTEPLVIDGNAYPEYAKSEIIKGFQSMSPHNEYDLTMLKDGIFGVPKIDRFMWQEGVLKMSDVKPAEQEALERYRKISAVVCKKEA